MSPELLDTNSSKEFSVLTAADLRDTGSFSNFISSVYQAAAEDKQDLVNAFMLWADSTTGIPYIEDSTVFFLYLNGSSPSVRLAGDFNNWNPEGSSLNHLTGTNLYYRGLQFESDARLDYKYVINSTWILDPLNPHTCTGGFGPNSELAMPGYIQPVEIRNYAIPHGTMYTTSFTDTTQGRTRTLRIYTPPGYSESTLAYRCMYFLDGSEYVTLGSAGNILDYLIAQSLIPPVIGVFTDPTDRMEEYSYDYDFMEMFVTELVPWVDANYRTMLGPESRGITGVSLGGLTALLFTLEHPEIFANCGAYSPAVWIGDIIQRYGDHAVLPVKIYMDAGSYEPSIMNPSTTLASILNENGWDSRWRTWHEGHSWGAWRAHLDESLVYFWPLSSTGIDERY